MPQADVSPRLDLRQGQAPGAAGHGRDVSHLADPGKSAQKRVYRAGGGIAPLASAAGVFHADVAIPGGRNTPAAVIAKANDALPCIQKIRPILASRHGKIRYAFPKHPAAPDPMVALLQTDPLRKLGGKGAGVLLAEPGALIDPDPAVLNRRAEQPHRLPHLINAGGEKLRRLPLILHSGHGIGDDFPHAGQRARIARTAAKPQPEARLAIQRLFRQRRGQVQKNLSALAQVFRAVDALYRNKPGRRIHFPDQLLRDGLPSLHAKAQRQRHPVGGAVKAQIHGVFFRVHHAQDLKIQPRRPPSVLDPDGLSVVFRQNPVRFGRLLTVVLPAEIRAAHQGYDPFGKLRKLVFHLCYPCPDIKAGFRVDLRFRDILGDAEGQLKRPFLLPGEWVPIPGYRQIPPSDTVVILPYHAGDKNVVRFCLHGAALVNDRHAVLICRPFALRRVCHKGKVQAQHRERPFF